MKYGTVVILGDRVMQTEKADFESQKMLKDGASKKELKDAAAERGARTSMP